MASSSRGKQAIEISATFTGFAIIVVLLRLYTRFFVVRYAGIEDYLILLATLCSIGLTICIGIQVRYGMGQHIWTLTDENEIRHSLKAFWASLIVYYLSLGLTKSSILLQYHRVFPTKRFQIACMTILAIVVLYALWTLGGSVFACMPIRAFWTQEKPSRCIDQYAMWFTNAAMNIVTDLAIIILPMPVVRNLNLARRQKQLLIGVFAVGGFGCVVSILRLQSLVAISNSSDPTYDNPPAATWSSVETNVGIICSCLPCLKPLATKYFPAIIFSNRHGPNSAPPYSRSTGAHRPVEADTVLKVFNTKRSKDFDEDKNGDDMIKVITEVHIRVEAPYEGKARNSSMTTDITPRRGDSTETLVRAEKETV